MKKLFSRALSNLAFVLVVMFFVIAGNLIFGMIEKTGFFNNFLSNFWQSCWKDWTIVILTLPIACAARLGVITWIKKEETENEKG